MSEKRSLGELGRNPKQRREHFRTYARQLQDAICSALEEIDGTKFQEDLWEKEEGKGGGRTRVLCDGPVIEQGGCNWSEVWGSTLPPSILKKHPHLEGQGFYATGTSMVIHPRNPMAPTVHLNYRYFEAGKLDSDDPEEDNVWWFGGGMDLTPWYLFEEDCREFHTAIKTSMDKHSSILYPVFKRWADEYFYLKHRKEGRGIGGSFFDYQDGTGEVYKGEDPVLKKELAVESPFRSWDELFAFSKDQGYSFIPVYCSILKRRKDMEFTEGHRQWQLLRRGRYVEYNLVWDRGTQFGLQTGGRIESILMSLPPLVRWTYNYRPEEGSEEEKLIKVLATPLDWAS